MYAASGIAVRDCFIQHRAVCVPCDQDAVVLPCPVGQDTFHLFLLHIVLSGAGGVQEAS